MDPLLFGIQADVVGEVLGTLVLLSLIVERALSPIFEWRIFIDSAANKGAKEPIAMAVAIAVVAWLDFDALAIIFSREETSWVGWLITAGVVAGGSKGSMKLFRDWMGWKSSAQKQLEKQQANAG